MGTYAQWSSSKKIGRLMWVYGPESALVHEVVRLVRDEVAAEDLDRVVFDATADQESEIWDAVYSRSLSDGANRLIEVYNAESLKCVGRLIDWISVYSKHSPETTVLMVAQEEPIHPKIKAPRAVVVRCVMAKPDDKLKWTMATGGFSERTAKRLLEYKSGDLNGTAAICHKVRTLLPDMDSIELSLDTLCSLDEETPYGFIEALLEKDKSSALNSINLIPVDSVGKILSLLDYNITLVDRLRDVLSETPRGVKISDIPGFPMGRFSELAPVARKYTFRELVRCRQMLAILESYHRQGIQEGLLEALVCAW